MQEIFCEEVFSDLELLIEFVNNHDIKVINIFPNVYFETKCINGREIKCQKYVLIYSYNI